MLSVRKNCIYNPRMNYAQHHDLFEKGDYSHEASGRRARAARVACKLSQDQLAEALDLSKSTISGVENGRHRPSFEYMMYFALVHRIEPTFIMSGAYLGLPLDVVEALASAMESPTRVRA